MATTEILDSIEKKRTWLSVVGQLSTVVSIKTRNASPNLHPVIQIRLLQLGDIHMGMPRDPAIDIKDRKYPAPVASLTTMDPLISAARFAVNLLRTNPVDAILLVGDLAHQGNAKEYQKCVDYLVQLILDEWHKASKPVLCVPGNHDIDRTVIPLDVTVGQIWDKFVPLEAAWKKYGMPILATSEVKSFTVKKSEALAEITALNSCLGCGEYRGLPADLREAAHELVKKAVSADDKWKAIEQIDSPAFAGEHIEAAQRQIDGNHKVNVVLAHHNLLPQSTPRVALYAELINGGQVRAMLAQAKSPTLYCHGHIHDDPIEIVSVPNIGAAPMVSISAPILDHGFNVLELTYTNTGLPLGVIVQKFKIGRSHTFSARPHEEIRIPFRSSAEYFPNYQPPRSSMVEIIRRDDGSRFPALLDELNKSFSHLKEEDLAAMLLEAEWYGIVRIVDREGHPDSWQILRVSL